MATLTWNSGTAGDWNSGANWSPGQKPVAGDTAIVTAGTAELLSNVDPASGVTLLLGGAPTTDGSGDTVPNAFFDTLNNTIGPNFTVTDTGAGMEGEWAAAGITAFTGTISVTGTNALLVLGIDKPNPVGVKEGLNTGVSTNTVANQGNTGQFQNSGVIDVNGGAALLVTPLNTLDNSKVSMLIGTINLNDGVLASTYVTLGNPSGGIGTSGIVNLANGSTAAMQESSNIDVNFQDGSNNRLIFTSTQQGAIISGFQYGDTIEQTPQSFFGSSTPYENQGLQYNTATGVLQITTGVGGTPYLDYTLEGGGYTQTDFNAVDDASGNLIITLACFAAGTCIATEAGEVPVESLAVGDRVATASRPNAPCRPIVWIGHRTVDVQTHPDPAAVRPVRVQAGAFGSARPCRDLLLSPDHAVFHCGALIPVRYLVNGTTVAPNEAIATVTYFHVELATHDVLLAEGLPVESFLDTGNRAAFANGGPVVDMHPEFARRIWDAQSCAPLVLDGDRLTNARRDLLTRAHSLGHALTADPGLIVQQDGASVPVAVCGPRWVAKLSECDQPVRLVSRCWVPAHVAPDESDTRVLGIAISRLWLDGREVSLESTGFRDGWHAPEPGLRWTNGDGVLAVAGAREMMVEIAMTGRYWKAERPGSRFAA